MRSLRASCVSALACAWLAFGCGDSASQPGASVDAVVDVGGLPDTPVLDLVRPDADAGGGIDLYVPPDVDVLTQPELLACKPGFGCDDGDPCTMDDRCIDRGAVCAGTPYSCDDALACTRDVCLGDGTCEHTLRNGRCLIDGVCHAEGQSNPENPCEACVTPQQSDAWSADDHGRCDDGNPCTTDDRCFGGACVGTVRRCEDGNPCTDDVCDPLSGQCVSTNNNAPCEDDNPCTAGDFCEGGFCRTGPGETDCEDGNPCTRNSCNPTAGCVADPIEAVCNDENPCTVGDRCHAGTCAGTPRVCNDANLCTDDACDPAVGCVATPNAAPCDDNNVCTSGDTCANGACESGAYDASHCNDGDACTDDLCVPAVGCVHRFNRAPCETGDPCLSGDRCANGVCIEGNEPASCDDGNICTVDVCVPRVGCQYQPTTASCSDGNPCTEGDYCADGACQPGPGAPLCDDRNLCTDDICDPLVGCRFMPNEAPCEDANPCTTNDRCFWTLCLPGRTPLDCDDHDACTDDQCIPGVGCYHSLNAGPCEDGDPCTLGDHCVQGDCITGPDWNACDDANVCTDDSCTAGVGCQNVPNTVACTDENLCTTNEHCADGACTVVDPVDCEDGNDCTGNYCEPAEGCKAMVVQDFACRPQIVIDFPPRGATLTGSKSVTVLGHVVSPAGAVAELRINNRLIAVDPATGAFTFPMTAEWGMNLIIAEVRDVWETRDRVVQSYYYSTQYRPLNAAEPDASLVPDALLLWLGQNFFDSNIASEFDVANILRSIVQDLDLNALIPSPVTSGSAAWCDYDVYVSNARLAPGVEEITITNEGIQLFIEIVAIQADIYVDMDGFLCPSVGGNASIQRLDVSALLVVTIGADGLAHAELRNRSAAVYGLNVHMGSGLVGAILDLIIGFFEDTLVDMIEGAILDQLEVVPDLLEDTINSFVLDQPIEVPALVPGMEPATLNLQSRLTGVRYHEYSGIELAMRGGVITERGSPYDPLGSILRDKCGDPNEATMSFDSGYDVQLAAALDFVNQILYGVYWAGVTEISLGAEDLGDVALPDGLENLAVTVSLMLPPILNGCVPFDNFFMQVGDIRINAEFDMFGLHVVVELYASAEMEVELTLNDTQGEQALGLRIVEVRFIQMEVASLNDELLGSEDVVSTLLEGQLMPAILDLAGSVDVAFPLPTVDLHALAPQYIPAGTMLRLDPENLRERVGYIVISGNL